jgi:hypothetical protein
VVLYLIAVSVITSISICFERYRWNKGISRISKQPWTLDYYESNGCSVYKDGVGNYMKKRF